MATVKLMYADKILTFDDQQQFENTNWFNFLFLEPVYNDNGKAIALFFHMETNEKTGEEIVLLTAI